ncbi:MAG: MarR family transcriptional regulator [Lysobacter sp.]|nr:MarR family transcriptional regulator [Lysobacter sp.]
MNTALPPSACNGSSLGLLFRQVRDSMWAQMERELAAAGHALNFSQFITIKTLAGGNASVTELARAAYLHPGAMTRLLDKLEARGILERVADPADRRVLHVHLTPVGVAIWKDINECAMRVHELATARMSDAEQAALTRLLKQVRDNLTPGA